MGYSTDFEGKLLFSRELSVGELRAINDYIDSGPTEHGYIDLEVTNDFYGLKWNGAEKTRAMVEHTNAIIAMMSKWEPPARLTGELKAQGEESADRWKLVISESGEAQKVKIKLVGIECPHCREFIEGAAYDPA